MTSPCNTSHVPCTSCRTLCHECLRLSISKKSSLAPICRNVPDNPKLRTALPPRPYQISAHRLDNLQSVRSDREHFSLKSIFVSATNVFISVGQEKLRSAQAEEYGPYIDCIQNADAPLPEKETKITMSYYSVHDGLWFKSCYPGLLR